MKTRLRTSPPYGPMLLRPYRTASVPLPLAARSVGHYVYPPGVHSTVKTVDFVEVLWGVRGTGVMLMEGVERRLGPGQVGVYFPGNEHHFYALDEPWSVYWWTMDGPLAAAMAAALGLTASQVYEAGPLPLALLRRLERAMRNITPAGEYQAGSLAYQLLIRAARGRRKAAVNPLIAAAVDIIHTRWNDPQLGVDQIAQKLKVHRSQLSRRFHAALGVSPVTYLINLRVQNALSRLKEGDETVDAVARACGWSAPDYFSRCIRRATGLSPREFRRQ